jgi:hypothetical protein
MPDADLVEVVRRLVVVFTRRQVRHALIGTRRWPAEPPPRHQGRRLHFERPRDGAFPGLLEDLVGEGFEIDVLDVVRRWPVERFVTFWCGRVRIDWMQPVLPLYATVLNTAEAKPWLDAELRVATATGLILTKMVALRLQDQADIETLLIANRDEIDVAVIRREWAAVAAGEDVRTAWLEDALARLAPQRS